MKILRNDDVRAWLLRDNDPTECLRSIGAKQLDGKYLEDRLGLPFHLQFVWERLRAEHGVDELPSNALDSIPFYSLCRGLFLPLSGLDASKVAATFGLVVEGPLDVAGREKLIRGFLQKEIGLTLVEKLGCLMGDAFLGKRSQFRRDSLLRLLMSQQLRSRRELLDRLTHVGDVALLFAECRAEKKSDPPLTAAEVLRLLPRLAETRTTERFDLLRSVLTRCGKLEAFFLAKLLLRKASFGIEEQSPLLSKSLAEHFSVSDESISHAMALTDVFHVTQVLEREGADGLRAIQLQPLVPIRPALSGGVTEDIERYPVWVERKYDGIRLMLHKSSDSRGSVLCGAYTRNRGDWLELVPGLTTTIKALHASNAIVDGELYGTTLDGDFVRPATVYEVYAALQGQSARPVTLKFAAFDLIYLNGQDLTPQPLSNRRQQLAVLTAPLANWPLPIPVQLAEGQLASNKDDVNRLYQHFRNQGYEGVITKDLSRPYLLAMRDPSWRKRKPEITLDLVLMAAVYAVTSKDNAHLFGSYVIGARTAEGTFEIVGDVAGLDRVRDQQIQQEIMRDGLLTGRRIERPSSSGARPGVELRPSIVITVRFEGIVTDQTTGKLSLRDPKIDSLRSDKTAAEADTVEMIREEQLRQRLG